MNKQQLASKIWASANKMRSKIEASEYKDFILGFIFYKFLSDAEVKYLLRTDWDKDAMREYLNDANTITVGEVKNNLGYFIPYKNLFSTWIDPTEPTPSVGEVRDALNAFEDSISPGSEKVYKGIFDMLSQGLGKLGDTPGAQNKALNNLFELISDIPTDGREDYDVLGFIYEYLISNFAANAGKKAGEFYTPHEVALMMSEIVAHHLQHRIGKVAIYDPTSGSGSLLLNIGRSVGRYLPKDSIIYYAQELKEATYNLTRMNLVMRGIIPDNIHVRNGDTLEEDWPENEREPNMPFRFDAVVSNPPYSQEWSPTESSKYDPRYAEYGVAPKGTADYAFLLHDLYHVAPQGIMTIVLPHGVLFRGGSEEQIRTRLIENNNIEAIIGLPANIFFGTGIPTIVIVLRRDRTSEDVLFVDASKGFGKFGKNNQLRARDIRKIVDAVTGHREIPKFSRLVSRDEIRDNGYNLNIPRYVNSAEADEPWDIYATMFGGIPDAELDALAPLWQQFDGMRQSLFTPTAEGYSQLRVPVEDLADIMHNCTQVEEYKNSFQRVVVPVSALLDQETVYRLTSEEHLAALNINETFHALADKLFDTFGRQPFVDAYAAYQTLVDRWAGISADLEVLKTFGLAAARERDLRTLYRLQYGHSIDFSEGDEERLIPLELIQEEMFADDLAALRRLREEREATSAEIAELIESLPDADGPTPWLKEDGSAFVPKELKAKIKKIRAEYGANPPADSAEAMLMTADRLLDREKKQKKAESDALCRLIDDSFEALSRLTDDEIQSLLHKKWVVPVTQDLYGVLTATIDGYVATLTALAKKYGETLVDIDRSISTAEDSLATLIGDLDGNAADLAGLAELQKLLRHE